MGDEGQAGVLPPGTTIGNYRIVRHVGSGGMGSVYEATHLSLGKRVALKALLPDFASSAEIQARFLREGKLTAKLHHPHVVDVTDFGIDEGRAYLVMEFLDGEDLGTMLEREGPLTTAQAVDLLVPIAGAVASAHDEKIVHRDLKPENIILTTSGGGDLVPKVLDFGISKLLTEDSAGAPLTGSLNLLGTPHYMSPEQTRSAKHVDDRSDQYALAVIAYECLTGALPFDAGGVYELVQLIAAGRFIPPRQRTPSIPAELEAAILRGMSTRPADRYATTWELGAALLPFASLRRQVLWEPEFKGKASTYIGAVSKRTASSSSHRPVADPRDAPSYAATSLDLPNPKDFAPVAPPPSAKPPRPSPGSVRPAPRPGLVPKNAWATTDPAPPSLPARLRSSVASEAPAQDERARPRESSDPNPEEMAAAGLSGRSGMMIGLGVAALGLGIAMAWWVTSH